MASEDSDQLVSGFFPVHRLDDLRDLNETLGRLVPAERDQLYTACELLEVLLLRAPQRIPLEERDDRLKKIRATSHDVATHVLSVVVIPPVWDDVANAEILTKVFEARDARGALRNSELVRHLETGLVAFPARAV